MKLDDINVADTISDARKMLAEQKDLSSEFKTLFSLVLMILELLAPRLIKKNSKNSSVPPSQDPNRDKKSKEKTGRKPGGQPGRAGKKLKQVETPDEIISIPVDRRKLPKHHVYNKSRIIKRQVVDVIISRHVKEYQLEVLVDELGKEYVADTPKGASQPIQYGHSIKALCTYMSQYQMVPYARVEDFFRDQIGIPISQGSIFNFNKEAYDKLASFEVKAKEALQKSRFLHADETGININSKLHWLHNTSNDRWTLLFPHKKRGKDAMEAMGVFPNFHGVAIHDHWKAYYQYGCRHSLCNAHHKRELTAVIEHNPDHFWAQKMKKFLLDMNDKVDAAGGFLSRKEYYKYRKKYRAILKKGDKECPPPPEVSVDKPKKRGRVKRSKERNLLERFINFEKDILRFIWVDYVPFTNNQGERDLRMAKVQQKISGCFKTIESAQIHARIRSFILTAQKKAIQPSEAINSIFQEKINLTE
jgi:transposase